MWLQRAGPAVPCLQRTHLLPSTASPLTLCPCPPPPPGEVKLLVSGASPISKEVFDFLRICFGCNVLEGYGMTGGRRRAGSCCLRAV